MYESERDQMKNSSQLPNMIKYCQEKDRCCAQAKNSNQCKEWKTCLSHYQNIDDPLADLHSLVNDSNEWVNIQEVVRVGFQYVSNKLFEHENLIRILHQQIEQKINKQDFEDQISSKANANEVEKFMNNLSVKLASNISREEFDKFANSTASKEKLDEISAIIEKLQNNF